MAKSKNNSKRKTTRTKNKNIFKIEKPLIIIGIIMLAILIASYFIFDLVFTIILAIGIGFIFLIARLLDKIKTNKKRKRVLNIILIIGLILAIIVALFISAFVVMVVKEAPTFDITQLDKKEASIFYDKDGNEFARVGQLRENITYDDLPEVFIDALIATEDSRYFQHNGFDAPRFIKAAIGQAMGKDNAGGGSTLSMQLVKNTYTSFETRGIDGIIRKFTDIYLAVFKLEKNFTKEQIIEYYVNNLELANNAWGVEQASQTYFGKSVKDLNLSEASLLVGLFNAPGAYNPYQYPNEAASRRRTVLNLMVRHGYITQDEANMANAIPVESLLAGKPSNTKYQAYLDTVIEELIDKYDINPNQTSVLVYTNMDTKKQAGIDSIFNGTGGYKWKDDQVQSGVAVVEVSTGKLVAVGAGRNRTARGFNYATDAKRQIGSTAKPIFDYAPAIEYLGWSTYQQIIDEPWKYSNGQSIGNSDGKYKGAISMRTALSLSRNIPALKAFQSVEDQVGNAKIAEFARGLGIEPQTDSSGYVYEAHSLGAFDGTTPLQMAAAYAAFSNGGTYYEPTTINKIVFRENNDVKTIKNQGTKAMSESTAFMITDMLITAVNSGYSGGAKVSGVTVAAKTGTTNLDSATKRKYGLPGNTANDAWIVGYDPEYAISLWYGYKEVSKQYYNTDIQTGSERGKIFKAVGNVVFEKNNSKTFKVPNSVKKICVEKDTWPAALPSAGTPEDQITCEYFKTGSEPQEVSTKYDKLETVKNLKVTYDENTQKITISWSALNTPTANESFGAFGYKVYYGDVLLDFTTENSYIIEANANISGTYKVITSFENYADNQSAPAVYVFEYKDPNATPTPSPSATPSPSTTPTPNPSASTTPTPSATTSPSTSPAQ